MAEIRYKCNLCDNEITKFVFKKEDFRGYLTCHCGGVLERVLKAPTVRTVEVLDNGVMPRRVEQQKDIKEILVERSKKHDDTTKKN